jgi:hypothetical protein
MDLKNKLLIQGNISEREIAELSKYFIEQDVVISKYSDFVHHGDNELLNLIFQDFHVLSFTRDYVLSTLLTSSWKYIGKVVNLLNNRNKQVANITVKFDIKNTNEDLVFLNISVAPDKFEIMIKQSDSSIDLKILDSKGIDKNIYIELDSENSIKIKRL